MTRVCLGACLAFAVVVVTQSRADDAADKLLADLQKRVESVSGDGDKLRADLLKFRRDNPGTPHAVRAAELLSKLPSPLDNLDPATIPELEKFDWHTRELVAVLGEARGRQAGNVNAVAYSPDGKLLVSGGSNGLLRFWDPATLRQKAILGGGYSTTSIVFSRDGKTLAAANAIGQVYFWDMSTDPPRAGPIIRPATVAVNSLSFSPGGKLLAAGGADNFVRVFDMTAEKEPSEKVQLTGHTSSVNGVAYAPDAKVLVSVGADASIHLWDPAGDQTKPRAVLQNAHKAAITCLAYLPGDAKVMATGCADGGFKIWDMSGARPRERVEATTKAGAVLAIAYTITGKTLATAHADGSVRLWDPNVSPPRERFVLQGHADRVNCLAFAPNGLDLASGSHDWTVRTWDLSAKPEPRQRAEPRGHLSHVYASQFSPDDTTLATGSYDKAVRLWSIAGTAPKEKATLTSEDNAYVYTLAWSPDGKMVVSGGNSTTVRVWNAVTGDKLRQLKPNPGVVHGLAFSPDNKSVLAASANTVVVWDANTTDQLATLTGHEATVNSVAVSPDGKRAVTGAGQLKYENGRPVIIDGKYVYIDPVLRLFDLAEGKLLSTMKSFQQPVANVAFSPDGSRVLAVSAEGVVRQLDVGGAEPREGEPFLKGVPNTIRQPVFSPDGKKVATLGPGASVVVSDAAAGTTLHQLKVAENVGHVCWAGDSRHLAVTAATGAVYVFRLGGPTK